MGLTSTKNFIPSRICNLGVISAATLAVMAILVLLIVYAVRFDNPIGDPGEEAEERSDFIWGILSVVPGILLGGIFGSFVVGMLFNILAPFDPPVLVLMPILALVLGGIVLLFSVIFMQLYYRLGLPQNIEINWNG